MEAAVVVLELKNRAPELFAPGPNAPKFITQLLLLIKF